MQQNEKKERAPELFLEQTPANIAALDAAGVFYHPARCRQCRPGTDLTIKPVEERGRTRYQVTCKCGNSWIQDLPYLSVSVPMTRRATIIAEQATRQLREAGKKLAKISMLPNGSDADITVKIDPFAPGGEIKAHVSGNGAEPTQWFKAGLPGQLPAEVLEGSIPPEVRSVVETIKAQLKGAGQWVAPPELPADLCWKASVPVEHVSYVGNSSVVLLARLSGGELEDGRPSPAGVPGIVYQAVRVLKVSGEADGSVLIAPFRGAIDPDSRMPIEIADDDADRKFRYEGHASSAPREFKRVAWAAVRAAQEVARGKSVQVPVGWGAQQQQQQPALHQAPRPKQLPPQTPIGEQVPQPVITSKSVMLGNPQPPAPVGDPTPTIPEEIKAAGADLTSPLPEMPPITPPGFVDELSGLPNSAAKPTPRRRMTKPVKKTSRSRKE